jgi:prepilin-type N-terminal cleavage/methylation domain-containing protein
MKKQGFSLIELMVVIVIMGILAAVAVPKLFGFIDKAKVSEIGPAAGTYAKLQEAYTHEYHKGGSWKDIGYRSPAGNDSSKSSTSIFEYDAAQSTYNWSAKSLTHLNNCPKARIWFVNFTFNASSNYISFWASSNDATNCIDALIPNFTRLSTTSTPIEEPGRVE